MVAGPAAISLDQSQPIDGTVLTKCLKLDAGQASAGHRVGIANDGYWGIPVKPEDNLPGHRFTRRRTAPAAAR